MKFGYKNLLTQSALILGLLVYFTGDAKGQWAQHTFYLNRPQGDYGGTDPNQRGNLYSKFYDPGGNLKWELNERSAMIRSEIEHRRQGESTKQFCRRVKAEMAPNDGEIEAADQTHDLFERIDVRRAIIKRSRKAAECWECGDAAKKYEDYKNHVKKQLPAIEKDLSRQCDRLEASMKSNDGEIAAADRTGNLDVQINVRRNIIEKCRHAADYGARIAQTINVCGGRSAKFRSYQQGVESQMLPFEAALAQRNWQIAEAHRLAQEEQARQHAAQEAARMAAEQEQERQRQLQEEEMRQCGASEDRKRLEEEEAFEAAGGEYLEIEIDGAQLAEGLRNMEGMFNGQMVPDMNMFDKMMESFLGEEGFSGEGQSMADFDPSMAGDYAISSCHYRDEKFGVEMDIGRVTKFVDGEVDFDAMRMDIMTLSGIHVMPESGQITLALNSGSERVMIKSDLESLGNYVAQKTIEGTIYLRTKPESIPNVEVDKLAIWGVDKKDTSKVRSIASVVVDFLPYVGTTKAISELITGYDYVGGEDVSRVVAVFAVVGSVVPVPGAAKAAKFVGKVVTKVVGNMPDLLKKAKLPTKFHARMPEETAVLRKEFKTIRKKFIKKYADSEEAIKRFTVGERDMMRKGEMPKAWMVHHKHPIFKGGNNDFSNLRVMKKSMHDKYRQQLHYYQKGKNIYGTD